MERARADQFTSWLWETVEPYVDRNVLEVGCGTASLVPWFTSAVERYVGLDRSAEQIRENRRRYGDLPGVEFRELDILDVDAPASALPFSPDTILCLNVLEHLDDDTTAVRRMGELLTDGGWLIVQVPAHPWLYGTNDEAVGHRRRYERSRLRRLLDGERFTEVRIEPFNFPGILPWWIEGHVLRKRGGFFEGHSGSSLGIINRLVQLARWTESLVPFPVGLSWFGFARRGPS